ncbi:MAG: hypothetical protein R3E12_18725 [Candidatus Eisenbacteria bacterium]
MDARSLGERWGSLDITSVSDVGLTALARVRGDRQEVLDLADRRVRRIESMMGGAQGERSLDLVSDGSAERETRPRSAVHDPRERDDLAGVLATSLLDRGQARSALGRLSEAETDFRRALSIRQANGDEDAAAIVLAAIAGVKQRGGDPEGAKTLYLAALERMRISGHRNNNVVALLSNLSMLYLESEEPGPGGALAEEARAMALELESEGPAAFALYLTGLAAMFSDPPLARGRLERSLSEFRGIRQRRGEMHARNGLLHLEVLRQNYAAAYRIGRSLIDEIAEQEGPFFATTLAALGKACLGLGYPEAGTALLGAASHAIEAVDSVLPQDDDRRFRSWTRDARDALADERFAQAWEEGRTVPVDQISRRFLGNVALG